MKVILYSLNVCDLIIIVVLKQLHVWNQVFRANGKLSRWLISGCFWDRGLIQNYTIILSMKNQFLTNQRLIQ